MLDMGEPVRILDMACSMIRLSGLEVKDEAHPDGDIEIRFTGLRPGEKLYEELLIGENALPTVHSRIMRAEEEVLLWSDVERLLGEFEKAAGENNPFKVRELLLEAVSGFEPQCEVKDVVMKHQQVRDKMPPTASGEVGSQNATSAAKVIHLH